MLSKIKGFFSSQFGVIKGHPIMFVVVLVAVVVFGGGLIVSAYNKFRGLPGVNKVPLPDAKV